MPIVALGLACFLPSRADGDTEPMSVVLLKTGRIPAERRARKYDRDRG
jgi:hypothetical protein